MKRFGFGAAAACVQQVSFLLHVLQVFLRRGELA